jgi:hypothetical protein
VSYHEFDVITYAFLSEDQIQRESVFMVFQLRKETPEELYIGKAFLHALAELHF